MRLLQTLITPFLPSNMRLMIKASQLAEQGEYEKAIRLFEEKIGIAVADRDDSPLLHDKINKWLALHGQDDQTMMFVAQYASSLGLIRAYTPALQVLEAAMDLEREDYQDTQRLSAKLDRFWFDLDVSTRFMLWMGLHGILSFNGRTSEAMDVFKYDLGILHLTTPEQLQTNREVIKEIIVRKLNSLQKDVAAAYLTFIFPLFDELKLQEEGLVLFEQTLGLMQEDYQHPTLLSQKLNKWINNLQNPLTGKFALLGLAGSLYQVAMHNKTLLLLEAFANIFPADYNDVEILDKKWKTFTKQLPHDTAATYFRMLISMLETVRRNPQQEIRALVQADSGLRDADFEDYERTGQKLSKRLELLQEDTKGAYIFSLGETMDKVGMHSEAATCLEWFMDHHRNFWNIPVNGDPAIVHVVAVLSNWFRFFSHNPNEKVLNYCHQTMHYLRAGFGSQGIRLEDRKSFIEYISLLKTAVLNTGFLHIDLQDQPEKKAELATKVLLWDAELSQRILAERFLLERRSFLPMDSTVLPGQWPFIDKIPSSGPNFHINDLIGQNLPVALSDENEDISAPDPLLARYLQEQANPGTEIDEDLALVLRQSMHIPLQADTLAQATGKNALILRAAFQDDGKLVWMLFKSDGHTIDFIYKHTGSDSDNVNISALVIEYESAIKTYWTIKEIQKQGPAYLNHLTENYLERLSVLFELDKLAPHLQESFHVVIQADGLLNTIPFTYLPIEGRPIFLQVASIHQSISLLFQTLQQKTKEAILPDSGQSPKVVVASWFKPTESVYIHTAAQHLHAEHRNLAHDHGFGYYALAEQPPCSIESIAGLVQQQKKVSLLTVMGHGNTRHPGIQMKNDELWYGNGCDLSGVDLVLMVSCSIGRMQTDRNNLDVEGFCVQLAVNRAFSLIACRWQVDAWQACLFANEIAKQYLLLKNNQVGDVPFVKAKALNEARKAFQKTTGTDYLNTLAAFEFYGLG
jgi:tetratricopeptide (TPR) repeat protein